MFPYNFVFPLSPGYRNTGAMAPQTNIPMGATPAVPSYPVTPTEIMPGVQPFQGMMPGAQPCPGMMPEGCIYPYMQAYPAMQQAYPCMQQAYPGMQQAYPGGEALQYMNPGEDLVVPAGATMNPDDPPPVLSNGPVQTTITLTKELTGYPNYGNPSRNADILYTGNTGNWTFNLPTVIGGVGNIRGQLVIRGVLDDHYNVNENLYSMTVGFNGIQVFSGRPPFVHGRPTGTTFDNWNPLVINISNFRRNNRISITNTSRAGVNDWIAIDWIEIRIRS